MLLGFERLYRVSSGSCGSCGSGSLTPASAVAGAALLTEFVDSVFGLLLPQAADASAAPANTAARDARRNRCDWYACGSRLEAQKGHALSATAT